MKQDLHHVAKSHHVCLDGPELGDEVGHGDWHGEQAEKEVGDGQVGDEDIPGC